MKKHRSAPSPRPDDKHNRDAGHQRHSSPAAAGHGEWLFGIHAVEAAWTNPKRRCKRLLTTDAGWEALARAHSKARHLGLERPDPVRVERREIDRLLPGAVHQGMALDVAPLPDVALEDLCTEAESKPNAHLIVLDQVTDPHNVGAILRSASAFGAMAVIVTDRHAPESTGTLAKSASGALEHVPLVRVTNLARAMDQLQQAGFWCVGLAESGQRTLSELDLSGKTALVLGAEGTGLRRLIMESCDEVVRLPTAGPVGSLNVSNAAAVSLYEVARRR